MRTATECVASINEYLSVSGLFNPEMMEHDKVRDLLVDCRYVLQQQLDRLKGPHDEPKMLLLGNAIDDAKATGRAEGMREAATLVRNKFPSITPEQADAGDRWQAKLPELITDEILAAIDRKEGMTNE